MSITIFRVQLYSSLISFSKLVASAGKVTCKKSLLVEGDPFACLQIGDASASASPLSFGGFGSMLRHLGRLTGGLDAALTQDSLSKQKLQLLQVIERPSHTSKAHLLLVFVLRKLLKKRTLCLRP